MPPILRGSVETNQIIGAMRAIERANDGSVLPIASFHKERVVGVQSTPARRPLASHLRESKEFSEPGTSFLHQLEQAERNDDARQHLARQRTAKNRQVLDHVGSLLEKTHKMLDVLEHPHAAQRRRMQYGGSFSSSAPSSPVHGIAATRMLRQESTSPAHLDFQAVAQTESRMQL